MKLLKSLYLLAISTSALGSSQGAGDIASVEKRTDGLYDVTCSYGDVERGVSRADVLAGNVCEAVEGLKSASVSAMDFDGGCSTHRYKIEDGIVGSEIGLTGFKLTRKDFNKGCTAKVSFKIPVGYKLGLKTIDIHLSLNDIAKGESVDVRFSAGNGGAAVTKTASAEGDSSVRLDLPQAVFSACATDKSNTRSITFDLLAMPNVGKRKLKGTASIYSAKLQSASLARCEG